VRTAYLAAFICLLCRNSGRLALLEPCIRINLKKQVHNLSGYFITMQMVSIDVLLLPKCDDTVPLASSSKEPSLRSK